MHSGYLIELQSAMESDRYIVIGRLNLVAEETSWQ